MPELKSKILSKAHKIFSGLPCHKESERNGVRQTWRTVAYRLLPPQPSVASSSSKVTELPHF